jgi:hypothetical protein
MRRLYKYFFLYSKIYLNDVSVGGLMNMKELYINGKTKGQKEPVRHLINEMPFYWGKKLESNEILEKPLKQGRNL